jgi:outer membrane protein assembly factor BamB
MSDATPRTRHSLILWTSLVLFGLFAVQAAYQYYSANRIHIDVDTDLSAELAEATLMEEEPAAASAGWPQWRGPRRDGIVRAPDLLTAWPDDGPTELWQARIGDGYSSFAVKDGRVYTLFQQGGQEVVQCWRAEDGKEVWHHAYDSPHAPADYPGPRSTPTLDGDRVYTVGSAGTFLCLDAANGSPHWKHELLTEFHASPPKWGIAFSPLIDGDLVFTSPGGRGGNSLAAFNKTTGELVWKALDDPAGYSSPIAVTIAGVRQIVFFTGDNLVGVTAREGKPCWRFAWETTYDVNAATPLFFQARKGERILDYVFISSGYGKGCALLKIASSASGRFQAKMVYQGNQLSSHFASPIRHGDYLYGFDDSRLICLEIRTGKVKWTRAGVNKGSLLCVDDHLLVLGEQGKLSLVQATPKAYEEEAGARPFRKRCWTMPVLADGRLFLRAEEEVKCLDLRKSR